MLNTLETHNTISPYGKAEDCAGFVIDDAAFPFVLSSITTTGRQYTFSLWVKSESAGSVTVAGNVFQTTEEWSKHVVTFTAASEDLAIAFGAVGAYYIYHPQLEIGNKATDWTPAPEDVESDIFDAETKIQQLADSISSLVRNGDSGSLIHQTADGLYYFDISDYVKEDDLTELNGNVAILQGIATNLEQILPYVKTATDENGDPCLELGKGGSDFKVTITNQEIQFIEGTAVPAKINRQMLIIEKTMVKSELQFGDDEEADVDGVWIWKRRSNGNLGLMWKEVVR